jgi:hypothetical protein
LNNMQITRSQGLPAQAGNIVEKIIRDKEGKLVRARFFLYENAGRIKARLIDFTYIQELAHSVILAIGGVVKKAVYSVRTFVKVSIEPFLNFENIYLSGSKPRAPTL